MYHIYVDNATNISDRFGKSFFGQLQISLFIFCNVILMRLLGLADDFCGNTYCDAIVGDDVVFFHNGACTNDAVVADDCACKDDSTHTDHGVVADGTAVNDSTVTKGTAFANGGF